MEYSDRFRPVTHKSGFYKKTFWQKTFFVIIFRYGDDRKILFWKPFFCAKVFLPNISEIFTYYFVISKYSVLADKKCCFYSVRYWKKTLAVLAASVNKGLSQKFFFWKVLKILIFLRCQNFKQNLKSIESVDIIWGEVVHILV